MKITQKRGWDAHRHSDVPHFALAVGTVVGQDLQTRALQILLSDLVDLARRLLHCGDKSDEMRPMRSARGGWDDMLPMLRAFS